ncbi:hypothetical protein [Promicromonospora sp. NFX87]|uniref:hypothetical protein n=1 Tax=Promicromonospora sp. NFX87 TaxID=3402691 RepID=UPI003AFA434A
MGRTQIAVDGPAAHVLVTRTNRLAAFEVWLSDSLDTARRVTDRTLAVRYASRIAGIDDAEPLIEAFNSAHPVTVSETLLGMGRTKYGTPPSHDVPVLSEPDHCATCAGEITYDPFSDVRDLSTGYRHTSGYPYLDAHQIDARPRCPYCRTDDPEHVTRRTARLRAEGLLLLVLDCTRCAASYAVPVT